MSEHDDTYNSENEDDIDRKDKADKNAGDLKADDLKLLMSEPHFRRFMWHLLGFTNMHSVPDPRELERACGFFDGQRNVGLMYFAEIQDTCPELYVQMVKESQLKGNSYDD